MNVLDGDFRYVSDDTAARSISLLIGDSALPLGGIDRPAAAGGGNLHDGKSCKLA